MITKKTHNLSDCDFNSGEVILINKPYKWTSFKVVSFIRRLINVKKVGHAGTLDPFAEGLLIVCTGKKTKDISQFQNLVKTYEGIITLGKTTASMDLETEIIQERPYEHITASDLENTKRKFLGEIEQIPPMYSAAKKKGVRLYELARKGKTVQREPKKIFIHDFKIIKVDLPNVHFEISCSKGTYIRVIANDFGESLGCGAVLSHLKRTRIGNFTINDALKVDDFKKLMSRELVLEKQ